MSNKTQKEIPRSVAIVNELKANEHAVEDKKLNLPSNKPPKIIGRMIELLTDVNLDPSDVDRKLMEEFPHLKDEGWRVGSTKQKMKKYPLIAKTAKEARALLWRKVGRSKIDGFKAISDCLKATKTSGDGSVEPDHKMRHDAAKTMLTLMGEDTSSSGAKTNINISGEGDHKIMIVSSDGKAIKDAV